MVRREFASDYSIVLKPGFTKGNYTEAADGEIRCDILTVDDVNISTFIDSKQNTLTPGTNITIVDNIISAMVRIWCTRSLGRLNFLDLLLRHNALVGGHPGPRKKADEHSSTR